MPNIESALSHFTLGLQKPRVLVYGYHRKALHFEPEILDFGGWGTKIQDIIEKLTFSEQNSKLSGGTQKPRRGAFEGLICLKLAHSPFWTYKRLRCKFSF